MLFENTLLLHTDTFLTVIVGQGFLIFSRDLFNNVLSV